jgi:hypothetical protein
MIRVGRYPLSASRLSIYAAASRISRMDSGRRFVQFFDGKSGMHDDIVTHSRIFQQHHAGRPLNTVHIDGGHFVFNADDF